MTRNILFCAGGIVLGLIIGFFVANALGGGATPTASNNASAPTTSATPRPLRPDQTELPPDHPPLDPSASGTATGALTPQEQAAADSADQKDRDFDAQMNAAAIFYTRGDYARAARYLERALALRPRDATALTAMGNTKYDSGDFNTAASFYERSLAVKPDDPDVRTDLGNTFFQRNPPDYERAIAEYRKSVAVDPNHEKTWQNMAAAAIRNKNKTTASQAHDKLSSLNPQNPSLASLRQSIDALP